MKWAARKFGPKPEVPLDRLHKLFSQLISRILSSNQRVEIFPIQILTAFNI
jgi:hypothetical protein